MSTSTESVQKTGSYQNVFVVAIVLFLVATAVTIMQYKIPTIMVPIMEQFAIDANTAAWTMSIFTFTGIVLALPVGMLSRKFGPKNLIIAALILDIIASVAGAFVSDIALLLVTRALEGASLVCVIACGPVVLQQTVDPARMGIATGIWMLGGMLGAHLRWHIHAASILQHGLCRPVDWLRDFHGHRPGRVRARHQDASR